MKATTMLRLVSREHNKNLKCERVWGACPERASRGDSPKQNSRTVLLAPNTIHKTGEIDDNKKDE